MQSSRTQVFLNLLDCRRCCWRRVVVKHKHGSLLDVFSPLLRPQPEPFETICFPRQPRAHVPPSCRTAQCCRVFRDCIAKRPPWNHLWKFILSRPQRAVGKLESHCHASKIWHFPTIYASAEETAFSALILWRKAEPSSQILQSARSDPLSHNVFSPTRQGTLRAPFSFVSHLHCV